MMKQNEWKNFQKKGSKQSKGHFAFNKTQQSIFKSPETVEGKVGVVGSGQAMTSYQLQKKKFSEAFKDKKDPLSDMMQGRDKRPRL